MRSRTAAVLVGALVIAPFGMVGRSNAGAGITVTDARIGCLRLQHTGNLTQIVAGACNGKTSCSFKAPTESEYKKEHVKAETTFGCTQGMQITYTCPGNPQRT